jgi:hypothetical protein
MINIENLFFLIYNMLTLRFVNNSIMLQLFLYGLFYAVFKTLVGFFTYQSALRYRFDLIWNA